MLAVVTKTKYFEQGGGETRKKKPSRFHSMQDNGSLNTVNPFEFDSDQLNCIHMIIELAATTHDYQEFHVTKAEKTVPSEIKYYYFYIPVGFII